MIGNSCAICWSSNRTSLSQSRSAVRPFAPLLRGWGIGVLQNIFGPVVPIVRLVRIAADEYDVAVDDAGKVVNVHEYQDAWGFVQTARARAGALAQSGDAEVKAAAEDMLAQFAEIAPAFPALVPPERLKTDPSVLYGAAARMELGAHKVL